MMKQVQFETSLMNIPWNKTKLVVILLVCMINDALTSVHQLRSWKKSLLRYEGWWNWESRLWLLFIVFFVKAGVDSRKITNFGKETSDGISSSQSLLHYNMIF